MKVIVTKSDLQSVAADLLVLPFSSVELKKEAGKALAAIGFDVKVLKDFKAEAGELVVLYGGKVEYSAVRIALLGIGEGKTIDDWRKAAVSFASKAVDLKTEKVAFDCSSFSFNLYLSLLAICFVFLPFPF